MAVVIESPELSQRIEGLARLSGQSAEEVVREAVQAYTPSGGAVRLLGDEGNAAADHLLCDFERIIGVEQPADGLAAKTPTPQEFRRAREEVQAAYRKFGNQDQRPHADIIDYNEVGHFD